jgi:type VI secretion system protein ImpJ
MSTLALNPLQEPIPPRIQWHEGMLLAPQHFQQESARVDALVAWHTLATQPMAWGISELEWDESLLANGLLRIVRLQAILPDGMAVQYSPADSAPHPTHGAPGASLEIDLHPLDALLEQGEISIYLTVGRSRSMRDPAQPSRFRSVFAAPVEDDVSAALPLDIPRMQPQLALSAGPPPAAVWVAMKIMTLRKDNEIYRSGGFIPALLHVPAHNPIRLRAQALATQMRSKAAFLARQSALPSSRLEDRLSLLEQRERLGKLCLQLPVLEAVLRTPIISPYALFLALCAQLGPLSLLRAGAVPPMPQAWNHADPLACFEPLLAALEESVAEVSQDWRAHAFSFEAGVFSIDMQAEWLGKRLVVGLRGTSEPELKAWMDGAIIGSRTIWTALSDRRVLGAPRHGIEEAPELGLRTASGMVLYAIEVSAEHMVADQPLVISNAHESPLVQRPRELVLIAKG